MTDSADRPRSLSSLTFLILLAVGGRVGAVYWFAWRPLAKTSGDDRRSGRRERRLSRSTALGVPHIRAANLDDALFAQGYCTAQERMFQMDLLRRFNAGELAEVFGPQALESDRESRRLRLRRIAEDAYVTLPAADRAAFAAYARGVNHYIATHRGNLPVEFTLARLSSRARGVSSIRC